MNMSKILFLFLLLLPLALSPSLLSANDKPNSCPKCHAGKKRHGLKQCYAEWQGSIHARKHVSCHNCHGGNPEENSKGKAHKGVYGAMNPASNTYYTKIPGLCGGCHKAELHDFQATKHYQSLMDKGMGPHCITCHDSMSTKVLTPDEIESLCTICHNARNKNLPHVSGLAKSILERMLLTDQKIAQTERDLTRATGNKAKVEMGDNLLKRAVRKLQACKRHWHSFSFDRMAGQLDETDILIKKSQAVLHHPNPETK